MMEFQISFSYDLVKGQFLMWNQNSDGNDSNTAFIIYL